MADADVDRARTELYRLPRDEFTAARNELAKRLRGEGNRASSDAVRALRKPSAAAWVVDQLSHAAKDDLERLFRAGDRMLGAKDAGALRDAAAAEREAIAALLGRAEELAGDLPAATSERVRETLHAAAADPDVRAEVKDGRLERERQHVGFGAGRAAPAAPAPSGRRGGSKARSGRGGERERDERRRRREHESAQRERERAERAHARAVEHAREAQAELERAQAELETARERERSLAGR